MITDLVWQRIEKLFSKNQIHYLCHNWSWEHVASSQGSEAEEDGMIDNLFVSWTVQSLLVNMLKTTELGNHFSASIFETEKPKVGYMQN